MVQISSPDLQVPPGHFHPRLSQTPHVQTEFRIASCTLFLCLPPPLWYVTSTHTSPPENRVPLDCRLPLSASRQASSALSEALCHMSPPVCLATVTSQHPFTCWSLNPRESEESPNKPSQVPTRGNKESEGKRPGQGHVGSRRQSWDLNLGLSEPVPHARASIPSVHGA